MRVAIGSDHAGFELKGLLCTLLDELRVEYRDFGTYAPDPVDYPDVPAPVARAGPRVEHELGIVLRRSGTGDAIVGHDARRIPRVAAADPVVDRRRPQHNDANPLAWRRAIPASRSTRASIVAWSSCCIRSGGAADAKRPSSAHG